MNIALQKLLKKRKTGVMVLAVMALLSLKLLLVEIMGDHAGVNEVDVLPLAKQYVDSTWIPGDWYLNQPPGYRLLFQALFGRLLVAWGFLATSVVGRLLCYGLVASGLVLIGRVLGLSLPLLSLAVFLFLDNQSLAAGEWLVGGLEAKSFAYGLVLLAIGLMLEGRYLWMALMLGLATSFHVLVGSWAFLVVLGWLVLRKKTPIMGIQHLGLVLLIYLATSAFAVTTVVKQLFTPTPVGSVLPSYVYVFVRLPHHLNPLSWPSNWWVKPIMYLVLLALSIAVLGGSFSQLWRKQQSKELYRHQLARMVLVEFTLLSIVPFVLGLAIAPFDSQGSFLQYYPFRLGDVMLPLNTSLLFACALEQTFTGKARRVLLLVCIVLLSWNCSTQAVTFKNQLLALRQFPSKQQQVDPEWRTLCTWVRSHTPQDAIVVSPPVEFPNFTWLAERPTIAKFKLLPQTKTGILTWYNRLRDLSGKISPWPTNGNTKAIDARNFKEVFTNGYNHLTTAQAEDLMIKYQADYFVTKISHQLELPIVFRNSLYILYGKAH